MLRPLQITFYNMVGAYLENPVYLYHFLYILHVARHIF
jgi:hypothetical protein